MHFKASGKYRLQVVRPDGSVKQEAEFDNLITDEGLNRMGTNADYLTWCQVGSGSTAPAVTDSALVNRLAGSSTISSQSGGVQSSAPYYANRIRTFSFAAGTATGNISEVGVGWASTGSLFSRALVLDGGGSPTTITVLADETLYVTYEFRLYPSLTDSVGDVTLTGNIGGTYDYTWRACDVDNSSRWAVGNTGTHMGETPSATAFNGAIGAITAAPSGSQRAISITANAYSNNSWQRSFTVSAALAQGNQPGGILSMQLKMGPTTHQVQFDPAIPKTASDTLNLVVSHSWGRV